MASPTLPQNYVVQFRTEQQSDNTVFDTKRAISDYGVVERSVTTRRMVRKHRTGGAVTYTHAVTNSGNVSRATPTAAFLTQ